MEQAAKEAAGTASPALAGAPCALRIHRTGCGDASGGPRGKGRPKRCSGGSSSAPAASTRAAPEGPGKGYRSRPRGSRGSQGGWGLSGEERAAGRPRAPRPRPAEEERPRCFAWGCGAAETPGAKLEGRAGLWPDPGRAQGTGA